MIRPVIESLLNSILNGKTGVITATKKEFIEKNLSNKIVLFRQFFEGVKTFMKGNYAIFINLQDCKNNENLIYFGLSKENSLILSLF